MHPSLRVVTSRLPHVQELATCLFERDEEFRELCEEYQACREAMARIDPTSVSAQGVRQEYAGLLLRLEGELLRYVDEQRARRES